MPSGINICCKLTKMWDPKLANFYKEMYARGKASPCHAYHTLFHTHAFGTFGNGLFPAIACLRRVSQNRKNRMLSRDNCSIVSFSCMSLQQILMTLLISNYFTWQIEGWSLKFLFEPKLRKHVASIKMSIVAINHCLENNNGTITNTVVLSKYSARHWNVKKYR